MISIDLEGSLGVANEQIIGKLVSERSCGSVHPLTVVVQEYSRPTNGQVSPPLHRTVRSILDDPQMVFLPHRISTDSKVIAS